MLLALTGYETGLLVVAAAFIVFALVVALVIPRSRPSFPGNRLGLFLAICGVFFVAQMTAVLVLAEVGEADESAHEETAAGEGTEPTETEATETEATETEPAETAGSDPVGKEIFLGTAGCASCHTLADAGATGTIGPNLDVTKPSVELAVERVTNGAGAMPSFADTLSAEQIQEVATYVSAAAGS
ncbi:MAG TPA: cytochrome c [Gaiellaceae bacterium]